MDRLPKLHWEPFTADATVTDGELIEGSGLRVIHTPGHSPGHIALHHGSTGTVLVGDAVFNRGGLDLGRPAFAADPALRAAALARLPGDLRAIGFAHGADIDDAAGADAFTAFVRGLDRAAA
ncbi:MBL fold metallo-hydrolase [Streptacidiphilus sp. 4-A2]|nr:MBL fold metallo-hydrolase [Streptacidiphilus sp. 4-A2]